MEKTAKLILIGDSLFALIAYEYFTHDSRYEVVAFCVERNFIRQSTLLGLPVVPFETVERLFSPSEHFFFAAVVYTHLNRLRKRLYLAAKEKGYNPASYVSTHAFVWRNAAIGEHCFIFENNVVQPFAALGDNVVLWSGNHIGHHAKIGDHSFIASQAVISGVVSIGRHCFVGVNATIVNDVCVGDDCVIGAGALVTKNIEGNSVVRGARGDSANGARRLNHVKDDQV